MPVPVTVLSMVRVLGEGVSSLIVTSNSMGVPIWEMPLPLLSAAMGRSSLRRSLSSLLLLVVMTSSYRPVSLFRVMLVTPLSPG